jgi:hypothetical protein
VIAGWADIVQFSTSHDGRKRPADDQFSKVRLREMIQAEDMPCVGWKRIALPMLPGITSA